MVPEQAARDAARRAARAQKAVSVAAKVCKRCGAQKDAAAFPRNKLTADGLHSYCKCAPAPALFFNMVVVV